MEDKNRTILFPVKLVEFISEGQKEEVLTYHVQNCSSNAKKLRVALKKGSDGVFTLLAGKEEKTLAAGLRLPVTVKFTPKEKPLTHHGELDLFADEKLIMTIPIVGHPPLSLLSFSPSSLDFGSQVCAHQSLTNTVTITNTGKAEGSFSLTSTNLPSYLTIIPTTGTVEPNTEEQITVTLLCREIGTIKKSFNLQLDSEQYTIPITATIVQPQLEILDSISLTPMDTLQMGAIYYNTTRRKTVTLFNNSPAAVTYVAKLNTSVPGCERGVDMKGTLAMACTTGGLHQHKWREQCHTLAPNDIFQMTPNEGTIRPYQTQSVEVWFSPVLKPSGKGWEHHQGITSRRDYALFVHFMPVGLTKQGYERDAVELGLTATALPIQLTWLPNQLDFGECLEGVPNCQKLVIRNESSILALTYRLKLPAHYKTDINKGTIKPEQQHDIVVVFQPKQLGELKGHLLIEIIGEHQADLVRTYKVPMIGIGITKVTQRMQRAHLDDFSSSIRPHDRRVDAWSPYTKVKRHTYIDPDYTYNDNEMTEVRTHRQYYQDYLIEQRSSRLKNEINRNLGRSSYMTAADIGIEPASGISPPSLSLRPFDSKYKPITMKKNQECSEITNPLTEPSDASMNEQCKLKLSPQELASITLEPQAVQVGVVVCNNPVKKKLKLTNRHNQFIKITLESACPYLKFGSLSETSLNWECILPPQSCTYILVFFQSDVLGDFHESIKCLINFRHVYYIPVMASVTAASLTLSSSHITLSSPPLSTVNYTLEGHVTLYNPHHVPAQFNWNLGAHESYVAVTHMEGIVPAHNSLVCAVFCQGDIPLAMTPLHLTLLVENGDSKDLYCSLKYGMSDCSFKETRALFNPAPQFLPVKKLVHITNKGQYHGYFEVMGFHPPVDGLTVVPEKGCIPAGDSIPLTLQLSACEEFIFETWLKVSLHEGKKLSLRIAGTVEAPKVFINLDQFNFGSVYCGVKMSIPFTIQNMGQSHVLLSFDLSSYQDFSLVLPNDENPYKDTETDLSSFNESSNVCSLIVPASTIVKCTMEFLPTDVASYDFILPVLVNGRDPIPPPSSQWPPKRSEIPQVSVGIKLPTYKNTPKRRVLATALVPPLQIDNSSLFFHISPEMGTPDKLSEQEISLKNISSEPLTWGLRDRNEKQLLDGTFKFISSAKNAPFEPPLASKTQSQGALGYLDPNESFKFKILFTPIHHGQFSMSLPLFINGSMSYPYKCLEFTGDMVPGRITVSPPHIAIQPVPLGVTVEAQFIVGLERFYGKVDLSGLIPSFLPNGVAMSVSLNSPIRDDNSIQIPCVLTFSSSVPISITDCVTFTEKNTNTLKSVPFSVTADNSILTTYEFLSENLNSVHFQTTSSSGVPLLHLPSWTHKSSTSTSSLSSGCTQRDHLLYPSVTSSAMEYGNLFLQQSKLALCRYVSLFGWPEGVKHITEPRDLVECVGAQGSVDTKKRYSRALTASRGPLVDLIRYIIGRLPPGIPVNPPPCNTKTERVDRHFKELSIILAFLRTQGALLWLVVPESLMHWKDFCYWRETNPTIHSLLACATQDEFEDFSEKAWTHMLAQTIKILVLPKLFSTPPESLQPTEGTSNIYSSHEIMLLNWLNYHFQKEGKHLFGNNLVSRTIQTFDVDLMDCTVLGSLLTAYVPSLFNTHFKGLYSEPVTPEQVSHNSILLVQAIHSIGFNYDIQASDFSAPNPVMLILFCSHLFHILPHYTPSSTITLQGPLHTDIVKEITVENTSGKALIYRAQLVGDSTACTSFTVKEHEDLITIPPKSSKSLSVTFKAKCLNDQESTLLLIPKGGGGRQGYPLSFQLLGLVTTVHPKNTVVREVPLYQITIISVPISSAVKEPTEFSVELVEGEKLLEKKPKSKTNKLDPKASSSEFILLSSTLKNRSSDSMSLFHVQSTSTTLAPNQSTTIELEYIPLKRLPRQCSIILRNRQYGDIVYLVSTSVTLPKSSPALPPFLQSSTLFDKDTQTLYIKGIVGETVREVLNISNANEAFEAAIYRLGDWVTPQHEKTRRLATGSMGYASLCTAMKALQLDSSYKTYWDNLQEGADCLQFDVSSDSEYLKLPDKLIVPTFGKSNVQLPIEFSCETEGHYTCHIVLTSTHDVRMYCLEVMVICKQDHPEIEFRTPAFQKLTQRIPLANLTTKDWPLKVTITGQSFTGPSSLLVKACTTGYYPLSFDPRREETVKCQLVLVNTNDQTEHYFELVGIGERPLAHETINIHTRAKKRTSLTLHIPNTSDRTTVYRVDTDLDFISGPPYLTVTGNDVADYPVMVDPLVRGNYSGAVVFVAESRSGRIRVSDGSVQEHLWYQLNVTVDPAQPVDTYKLTAHTFGDNTLEIKLFNPISEPVTLKASIDGSYISGPSKISLAAESSGVYPLRYAPQRLGKEKGQVLFMGLPDGEMTIEINLEAYNPEPVELETPQCELGKSAYTTLTLNNPLQQEVSLTYYQTDAHFVVIGIENGMLILPPQSTSDVSIMFKPTQLGLVHEARLAFTSNEFGSQEFIVRGEGLPPSPLPPTLISSVLYQNAIAILSFTNPLSCKTNFSITLDSESDQFCLFLKQTRNLLLESGVSLDIPVMFTPETVKQCQALISVSASDNSEPLSWVYPLLGQPEVLLSPFIIPTLNTRAKERVEERLVITLQCDDNEALSTIALRPVTLGEKVVSSQEGEETLLDRYSYRLVLVDAENVSNTEKEDIFKASTALRLIKESVLEDKVELSFDVIFLPPRPFSCRAELQVQPTDCAIWRYPLIFSATDPVPDDVITLQAHQLAGEVRKGFRLTSLTDQSLPFKAHLTSSPELSFDPKTGVLPPASEKGLLFTVTYKPRSFNKGCSGKIVIETSTGYWLYEVRGKPVAYLSPKPPAVSAKVDHHCPILSEPSTKNFVRHNMHQLHVT